MDTRWITRAHTWTTCGHTSYKEIHRLSFSRMMFLLSTTFCLFVADQSHHWVANPSTMKTVMPIRVVRFWDGAATGGRSGLEDEYMSVTAMKPMAELIHAAGTA